MRNAHTSISAENILQREPATTFTNIHKHTSHTIIHFSILKLFNTQRHFCAIVSDAQEHIVLNKPFKTHTSTHTHT